MFTGLIEEIGNITQVVPIPGGNSLNIGCSKIIEDIDVDDSICVNGVCLTAIKIEKNSFWVEAVGATLEKSTFADITSPSSVNLERSLRLNDRLGGHLVQGHVNGIGIITEIKKLGDNYLIKVDVPSDLERYLIKEGSIAINGISLTIAELEENTVSISVIPHTWKNTNFNSRKIGDKVNIEIDILAKYIEKLIKKSESQPSKINSENWLKELGY